MSEARKTIEASSIKRKGTAATVDRVEMRCVRTKQGAFCIKLVSYTGRTMADLVVPSEGVSDLAGLIAATGERDARAAESARDAALRERDEAVADYEACKVYLADADARADAATEHVRQLQDDLGKANAAHADLLRNHRTAMEGAEAEIGRLRGALEELNSAFTALREMGGVNCNCEGDYRCVDCWGIAAIDDARAALASTATVSVEPAHDCDGVACWVCADQHHAAVEAQAEAQPSDKPDASAEGEGA